MHSFNQLNEHFQSQIADLYKAQQGRALIQAYAKMIKENKILKAQYELFEQVNKGVSADFKSNQKLMEEYANTIQNTLSNYSKTQIKEQNNKLYAFLEKHHLLKRTLKENSKDIQAVETLIYEGASNLEKFIANKNVLISEIRVRNEATNLSPSEIHGLIEDFNKQYVGKLTTEQIRIINELILAQDNQQRVVSLRECQKECIIKINKALNETTESDVKQKLLLIKEQVLFEDAEGNDIIKKVIKINEISNILDEEQMGNFV